MFAFKVQLKGMAEAAEVYFCLPPKCLFEKAICWQFGGKSHTFLKRPVKGKLFASERHPICLAKGYC